MLIGLFILGLISLVSLIMYCTDEKNITAFVCYLSMMASLFILLIMIIRKY
jgi:hypothetical protein